MKVTVSRNKDGSSIIIPFNHRMEYKFSVDITFNFAIFECQSGFKDKDVTILLKGCIQRLLSWNKTNK